MLFGMKLATEMYSPWKDDYIAYEKLKKLLKEGVVLSNKSEGWTEADETRFVSTLDGELEKVYSFQTSQYKSLEDRISALEKQANLDEDENTTASKEELANIDVKAMEREVEDILQLAQELDHFSRLNFTGFVKIVKKHDRLHPKYQVRPLLQVRLNALPFHSEDYSPLLYRLSGLYSFLSENFGSVPNPNSASVNRLSSFTNGEPDDYTMLKFWVHPDDVMEVKTRILRHLPVLVYEAQTEDAIAKKDHSDPQITSLYFDNSSFELYKAKLQKNDVSPSVRIRWTGKLSSKPEIFLEKRVVHHVSNGEYTPDQRLQIKEKYIQGFLDGAYAMEKQIQKMRDRHSAESEISAFEQAVKDLQAYILDHQLEPVLRTTYTRTAFQIPGDTRVRVILDSDISFIREDSFDEERPIRDPHSWHRTDIDSAENASSVLRKGEYSKFPYAVLEVRVKNHRVSGSGGGASFPAGTTPGTSEAVNLGNRHGKWIEELTGSHLVKEVPNFSKFIQGVASLFAEDDRLDLLPFWLPELEHDIRQDPKQAYEREKVRLNSINERRRQSVVNRIRNTAVSPQIGQPSPTIIPEDEEHPVVPETAIEGDDDDADIDDDESTDGESSGTRVGTPSKKPKRGALPFWPSQGLSKLNAYDSEDEEVILPPGVVKPTVLIRQSGPVKVETKVWLANERTFNKWLHITTLLSALTFTLYSSVGRSTNQQTAEVVAYILFGLTIFSGLWGYYIYMKRLNYIRQRSESHLDSPFGPLVIAITLLVSLIINFVSKLSVVNGEKGIPA